MFKNNRIYKIDINGNKKRIFFVKGLNIKFKGKNAEIVIHEPKIKFRDSKILCGSNAYIEFHSSKHVAKNLSINAQADNSKCIIQKDFSCTNGTDILLNSEPNLCVSIGNDCMFAKNITIRTSDVHTIFDLDSNNIINYGGSVEISDHCWIGQNVIILKNVKIDKNIVVGAGSIVTRNLENENSIYAGTPAKLIKSNIGWDRKHISVFSKS